jgi:hypothetical protein
LRGESLYLATFRRGFRAAARIQPETKRTHEGIAQLHSANTDLGAIVEAALRDAAA